MLTWRAVRREPHQVAAYILEASLPHAARVQQVDLSRVAVIGTSCSGKTTLARRLAACLDSRCVELDALHWDAGWTPRSDFEQQVRLVIDQPAWIIDGNYSSVRHIIWRRATAVVWLDYAFARIFSQAVRRTARRVLSHEHLYGNNRETIRGTLFDMEAPLWLVVRTYRRRRREFQAMISRPEYQHLTVIRAISPQAAETFLAGLTRERDRKDSPRHVTRWKS